MLGIGECDYYHAQRDWREFRMKNLGDYHNYLYLETDVLLLCNVFETIKTTCLEHYTLNPANFYTSPGLAWQTCPKKNGVHLELITDLDMLLMSQVQHGMGPLINMQKSVFLPLWDNHELYGRKILHIESFSAKESQNLVRIAKFFV